ncbi:hypothetical protein GCM10023238_01840 [Streptomyces heliomycini]
MPGLLGFRAVNTLDAMVGHKSPRYRRYGWASARLDDVAGLAGGATDRRTRRARGTGPARGRAGVARGRGEAPEPQRRARRGVFAGALGVRLGGTLSYGGRVEHRPVLGGGGRAVAVSDIDRAVRLSRRVGWLALGAGVAARSVMKGRAS